MWRNLELPHLASGSLEVPQQFPGSLSLTPKSPPPNLPLGYARKSASCMTIGWYTRMNLMVADPLASSTEASLLFPFHDYHRGEVDCCLVAPFQILLEKTDKQEALTPRGVNLPPFNRARLLKRHRMPCSTRSINTLGLLKYLCPGERDYQTPCLRCQKDGDEGTDSLTEGSPF